VFTSPAVVDHLLLTVRVAAGLLLIGASAQILIGLFGGPGLRGFARRAELLGMRASLPFAVCAGLSAAVSGVALIVGGLACAAAMTLIGCMIAGALPLWARQRDAGGGSILETMARVLALLCLAELHAASQYWTVERVEPRAQPGEQAANLSAAG